ncbi:MAG: hypothetical protein J0M29_10965 [Chitinophagales bacterium]|nr:hypothetical protein [Chitinophagales bacterium]
MSKISANTDICPPPQTLQTLQAPQTSQTPHTLQTLQTLQTSSRNTIPGYIKPSNIGG